jgi:hypothetical protein
MDGRHGAAGPGIREVSAAIGEAGAVLNRPLEIDAASGGLRPKFAGAIDTSGYHGLRALCVQMLSGRVAQPLVSFEDVT